MGITHELHTQCLTWMELEACEEYHATGPGTITIAGRVRRTLWAYDYACGEDDINQEFYAA